METHNASNETLFDASQEVTEQQAQRQVKKRLRNGHYEAITSNLFAHMLMGPYLTGYLLYLGASAGQVGFITAIPLLMNAVIVIASAFLMEKFTNRYKLIVVTVFLHRFFICLGGLVPFVAPQEMWVPIFTVLFVLLSLFGSLHNTPFTTLLAEIIPRDIRGKYFAQRFTIGGTFAAISLFITGAILERTTESTGFAVIYILGTIFVVINMVSIVRFPNIPYTPSGNGLSFKMLYKPFKDSTFFKSILFVSLWMMAQGSTISLFSYVMLDIMEISYEWVGISNTLLAVVSILAYMLWGRLNQRWSNRKLLLWVFPLNAVAILMWGLQAFIPDTTMLIVVYTMLGVSMAGFGFLVYNFVVSDTPDKERPIYYSVYVSMTGLFGFLGPVIGGWIFDNVKDWPLWFQEYGVIVSIGTLMLITSLTVAVKVFNTKD